MAKRRETITGLKKMVKELRDSIGEMAEQIADYVTQIGRLEDELNATKAELAAKTREVEEAKTALKLSVEATARVKAEGDKKIEEEKGNFREMSARRDRFSDENSRLRQELNEHSCEISRLREFVHAIANANAEYFNDD